MNGLVARSVAVLTMLVLAGAAVAGEIVSGLPAGAPTLSIPVWDVTGPFKGERICYVCDFEDKPNVLAFVREPSTDSAQLIVQLNRLYLKNKSRDFRAVVMMIAGADTKPWLEDLSRSENIHIPLTFFTKGPKDPAARVYSLNPAVRNTFLMTANRTVVANISDVTPSTFGRVVDATEAMLSAVRRKP